MQKIGFIDWTERELDFYIFEKKGNQLTLTDTISIHLKGELNQNSLSSLEQTNIKDTYLSVPVNTLSFRELRFPFSDKDKIRDSIPYELEGILLGDISDYSIDHIVSESLEDTTKILAVCIEKTKLKEIINTLSSVGIEPKVVTSIDLQLSGGDYEKLLGGQESGEEIRATAAKEELVNPSINLRQNELAYKGDIERIKKTFQLTAIFVLILFLIFGLDITLRFKLLRNQYTSLTKEIHSIYSSAFPADEKIVDAVRQFRRNLNILKRKKNVLIGIPALDILRNIANHTDNVTLGEFKADKKNIFIKGTAASFEDVESLKNTLSSSFKNVKVMDSNVSVDKKISFTIVMREKTI